MEAISLTGKQTSQGQFLPRSILECVFPFDHTVVEIFDNGRITTMAIVNFSVPDDFQGAFNGTFHGQNKSTL